MKVNNSGSWIVLHLACVVLVSIDTLPAHKDVVLNEVSTTNTYEHVDKDRPSVVAEHLSFMAKEKITVEPELRRLPSFYWLPKLHKQPYVTHSGKRYHFAKSYFLRKT